MDAPVKNFSALCAIALAWIPPTDKAREAYDAADAALEELFLAAVEAVSEGHRPSTFAPRIEAFAQQIGALLPTPTAEATLAFRALSDFRMTINLYLAPYRAGHADAVIESPAARHNLRIAVATAITFEPTLRA
jgi:hypothetical protein